jgi:hypothetical protein
LEAGPHLPPAATVPHPNSQQNPQPPLTEAAMMPSQKSPVFCGFCAFSPNGARLLLCVFTQEEQNEAGYFLN